MYEIAEQYRKWGSEVFDQPLPTLITDIRGAVSFHHNSKYFLPFKEKMEEMELSIVDQFIAEIDKLRISGAITEFGIFQGLWINRFCDSLERQGIEREVWGFDSFEGIPSPDPEHDFENWVEGSYCATLEEVRRNTNADQRKNIKFVPGWFSDSLLNSPARSLTSISYARIDCDLYPSTRDVLTYLSDRLSHGSILAFDDWTNDINIGITRAFAEWTPTVPHLEFEFLFFVWMGRFYIRCWHKGLSRERFKMRSFDSVE